MIGAIARGVSTLAFTDLNVFGGAIGALTSDVLRVRRAHVEASMARAGIANTTETARGMYRALGTSFVEVLWLAGARRDLSTLAHPDANARRVLAVARDRGRGVVFAASHTGNWEIASCAMSTYAPMLIVTKHLSIGWIDAFWQASRSRYGVSLIGASGAFARAREHVATGGSVAMMIDQVPIKRAHAIELPFLGENAWVDRAAATLAAKTGAMFIVPAARRAPDGSQELMVLEALEPPAKATRAWIDLATTLATSALDRFVRQNPTEWLWMHRRWKTPAA